MQKDKQSSDLFEVEKITGKKKFGKVYKYKVKWLNYPENKSTWEPVESLSHIPWMIKTYEASLNKSTKNQIQSESDDENVVEDKKMIGKKRGKKADSSEEEKEEININQNIPNNNLNNKNKNSKKQKVESSQSNTPPESEKSFPMSPRSSRSSAIKSSSIITSPKQNNVIKYNTRGVTSPTSSKILSPVIKKKVIFNEKEDTSSDVNAINNINDNDKVPEEGDITKNVPKRIITAKQHNNQEDLIMCEVEWLPNSKGVKPLNSFYSNKELKGTYPFVLCAFYETRLMFPSKLKNKK